MYQTPSTEEQHTQDEQAAQDDHELRMSLLEHLDELRMRFVRSIIVLSVGATLGFLVAGEVIEYLRGPYCRLVPDNCELLVIGPTGNVIAYFRVALMVGGILAVPFITYQIMMFLIPGLTKRERRYLLLSLPAIAALFLLGSLFAWFILMPPALGFLEGFQPQLFRPEWTADAYLGFVTALIFWMGVAFETPLVFFVLGLVGLVRARNLIDNWRVAVVGSAVAAALITPTIDPVNMFLVMGPLMGLYLFSIVLVILARRMTGIDRRQAEPG